MGSTVAVAYRIIAASLLESAAARCFGGCGEQTVNDDPKWGAQPLPPKAVFRQLCNLRLHQIAKQA
jgi:hypothetical protein